MVDYTVYDASGNVTYASPSMEERAKRPIICPKCVGSCGKKYCYFNLEPSEQKMTGCSDFEPIPANWKEWVGYYYEHKVRRRFAYYKYKVKQKLGWWKYAYITCGRLNSIIKEGDVIKYRYPDDYVKDNPELFGGEHEMKIYKLWVGYGHGGRSENGMEYKFYIMASTSCGISTLNALLDHKTIISINGNEKIADPGIYQY